MKKILLIMLLFAGIANLNAQIQTNNGITNLVTFSNVMLDGSTAFSAEAGAGNNIGKGIVFPSVDLVNFEFDLTLADGFTFPTFFDGMVVYNRSTGTTLTAGNRSSTATDVTPGFYYFSNPDGATNGNITSGVWLPFGCCSVAPPASSLTQPNPSDATICSGDSHSISLGAATGNDGPVSYNWQQSTDGSTWTNAPGTRDGQNYVTPALSANMYYRRRVTDSRTTMNSDAALITVVGGTAFTQPDPSAQSVSCNTAATFNLAAASGGAGTIFYQWQSSANNSTWGDISGATSATYTTDALSSNTYFRRIATASVCGGSITSASALVTVAGCPPAGSVNVGSYYWATRNVDDFGNFVSNVYNYGRFYQWNRPTSWANSGSVSGWNSTGATGTSWASVNDPCPSGFRVPTLTEITDLNGQPNVWVAAGNTVTGLNGTSGRIYGTSTAPATFDPTTTLFLPAAGYRGYSDSSLLSAGTVGRYWSSTEEGTIGAYALYFNSSSSNVYDLARAFGYSVRCVAE